MALRSPSTLPAIDAIDIVDLDGATGDRIQDCLMETLPARRVRITGAAAQQIAEQFRTLPPGEAMRCHIPPYGLVFYFSGQVIARASICWKCNNLFGAIGEDSLAFSFDGASALSKSLLRTCKQAMR